MKTKVNEDMLRRAHERIVALEEIESQQAALNDAKGDLKELRKRDIEDGYNDSAMSKVVAELRMQPDEFQEVLDFEIEHQSYRLGVGLQPRRGAEHGSDGNLHAAAEEHIAAPL